jgi:hypothetical protein
MAVLANGWLDPALDMLTTAENAIGTFTMHLFANNFVPGPTNVLGDFVEASYAGYASQACSPFGTSSGGAGGTGTSVGVAAVFAPGVLGSPQLCYGWYMTDPLNQLVGSGLFVPGPLQMGGTTLSVTITPSLTQS